MYLAQRPIFEHYNVSGVGNLPVTSKLKY